MVALLFFDFGNFSDYENTDSEVAYEPDSSSSSPLQFHNFNNLRNKSGSSEEAKDYTKELNIPDSFEYWPFDLQIAMNKAEKPDEKEEEKSSEEATDDSNTANIEASPRSESPRFTMKDIIEMNQLIGRSDRSSTTSLSPSDLIGSGQGVPADNNRVITIGNEGDYKQVGSDNLLIQAAINSSMNNRLISQIGRENYARQFVMNTILSELIIRSIGNHNTAVQEITNGYNTTATIIQNGSFNESRQEIYSTEVIGSLDNTTSEVQQLGYHNLYRSYQHGGNNYIEALQNGSLNNIYIEQNGNGNRARINQRGRNNTAVVQQN